MPGGLPLVAGTVRNVLHAPRFAPRHPRRASKVTILCQPRCGSPRQPRPYLVESLLRPVADQRLMRAGLRGRLRRELQVRDEGGLGGSAAGGKGGGWQG